MSELRLPLTAKLRLSATSVYEVARLQKYAAEAADRIEELEAKLEELALIEKLEREGFSLDRDEDKWTVCVGGELDREHWFEGSTRLEALRAAWAARQSPHANGGKE